MTTTNLHAHVSTSSSDCDGPMYRDYVATMNDAEQAEDREGDERGYNNFADLHFKARILSNHVSFHAVCEISTNEDGFHVHENTDEGYRAAEVRWCEDECDESLASQRDVYAEMMGY
jgi:hypothetical protein